MIQHRGKRFFCQKLINNFSFRKHIEHIFFGEKDSSFFLPRKYFQGVEIR